MQSHFRMKSFLRSDNGSAVIEAAFIIPIFLAIFLGSITYFDDFRASQTIVRAATTTVDLATRVVEIDDATAESIYASAGAVTGIYLDSLEEFTVVIASVSFSKTDDDFHLEWSISNVHGEEMTDADIEALDLPALGDGETVVVAKVTAKYGSYLEQNLPDKWEFSAMQMRRPRFGVRVANSTT